ncbi:MAG: hypothetical protein K5776_04855, partial [Lachnospiraceae bacterium]|nr:hypothetical protein [Lachnospiraceae bacterium]
MKKYDSFYEARNKIVEIVSEDLLGPVEQNEVINEIPTSYYIMGKLYPMSDSTSELDSNIISSELDSLEGVSLTATNVKEPSAMGITITVKENVSEISCRIRYALYKPYSLEEAKNNQLNISKYEKGLKEKSEKELSRIKFWKRLPEEKLFAISLTKNETLNVIDGVFLKSFVHMQTNDGKKIITIVLTNEKKTGREDRDVIAQNTLMQPEIRLESKDETPVFSEIRRQVDLSENEELSELEMLYSENKCYAQGHGCSVIWDMENTDPRYVESAFIPQYNLKQMKAAEIKDTPIFNMYYLHTGEKEKIVSGLFDFAKKYSDWIDIQRKTAEDEKYSEYKESSEKNLSKCTQIHQRIQHSINLLNENDNAWKAFRYANEAMFMQRCTTIKKQFLGENKKEINPDSINWYPFQLAFVLLEISSFIEPEGDDRKTVDLLWFPTGGGKTEAYLGIASFVIFYRRLQYPDRCDGLNIIMRYTLRLLT